MGGDQRRRRRGETEQQTEQVRDMAEAAAAANDDCPRTFASVSGGGSDVVERAEKIGDVQRRGVGVSERRPSQGPTAEPRGDEQKVFNVALHLKFRSFEVQKRVIYSSHNWMRISLSSAASDTTFRQKFYFFSFRSFSNGSTSLRADDDDGRSASDISGEVLRKQNSEPKTVMNFFLTKIFQ
nr:hypothetical protein Iba_chr09fCG12780 [Ipomoea batatas]GME14020.1 hypothetical protein Iba_scaffold14897CG0590 [Ipomoea batatas]